MKLLAIDPGSSTGWAYFQDGVLTSCGHCRGGDAILTPAEIIVIEMPQVYPRSRVNPNDLMKVACIVGRYQEQFKRQTVFLVKPRDWKGTIDKGIMLKRIIKGLTPDEVAMTLKHPDDTIDAIGLGKYWITRV